MRGQSQQQRQLHGGIAPDQRAVENGNSDFSSYARPRAQAQGQDLLELQLHARASANTINYNHHAHMPRLAPFECPPASYPPPPPPPPHGRRNPNLFDPPPSSAALKHLPPNSGNNPALSLLLLLAMEQQQQQHQQQVQQQHQPQQQQQQQFQIQDLTLPTHHDLLSHVCPPVAEDHSSAWQHEEDSAGHIEHAELRNLANSVVESVLESRETSKGDLGARVTSPAPCTPNPQTWSFPRPAPTCPLQLSDAATAPPTLLLDTPPLSSQSSSASSALTAAVHTNASAAHPSSTSQASEQSLLQAGQQQQQAKSQQHLQQQQHHHHSMHLSQYLTSHPSLRRPSPPTASPPSPASIHPQPEDPQQVIRRLQEELAEANRRLQEAQAAQAACTCQAARAHSNPNHDMKCKDAAAPPPPLTSAQHHPQQQQQQQQPSQHEFDSVAAAARAAAIRALQPAAAAAGPRELRGAAAPAPGPAPSTRRMDLPTAKSPSPGSSSEDSPLRRGSTDVPLRTASEPEHTAPWRGQHCRTVQDSDPGSQLWASPDSGLPPSERGRRRQQEEGSVQDILVRLGARQGGPGARPKADDAPAPGAADGRGRAEFRRGPGHAAASPHAQLVACEVRLVSPSSLTAANGQGKQGCPGPEVGASAGSAALDGIPAAARPRQYGAGPGVAPLGFSGALAKQALDAIRGGRRSG